MNSVTFYVLVICFLKELTFVKKNFFEFLSSSKTLSLYLINFSFISLSHVTVFGQDYMFYSCRSFSTDRHNLFLIVLDLIEWVCIIALSVLSNSSLEISYSSETCAKLVSFLLSFLFRFNACMVVVMSNLSYL